MIKEPRILVGLWTKKAGFRSMSDDRFGRNRDLWDHPRIQNARVFVQGCGSLGSSSVEHFWREGLCHRGQIVLADGDNVEESNKLNVYDDRHVGMPKPEALKDVLLSIESRMERNVIEANEAIVTWNRMISAEDITLLRNTVRSFDLLCFFSDDFGSALSISKAIPEVPQIMVALGPQCDYGEVGTYIPGNTARLSEFMGRRKRETIHGPMAFGFHVSHVASYVADLCCAVVLQGRKGADLLLPTFADGPMHIVGIRKKFMFQDRPEDESRVSIIINFPQQ